MPRFTDEEIHDQLTEWRAAAARIKEIRSELMDINDRRKQAESALEALKILNKEVWCPTDAVVVVTEAITQHLMPSKKQASDLYREMENLEERVAVFRTRNNRDPWRWGRIQDQIHDERVAARLKAQGLDPLDD